LGEKTGFVFEITTEAKASDAQANHDVIKVIMDDDDSVQCLLASAFGASGTVANYATKPAFKGANKLWNKAEAEFANIHKEGFVPRGAGWIYTADQYYWFSQIVYGDSSMYVAPEKVANEGPAFWMSGMLRWMIPLMGKPSPHNIILGQWEPTEHEAEQGIVDGFGAVSALLFGESQCGMKTHPVANARKDIYEGIIELLEGTDNGKEWKAKDAIFKFEKNHCEEMARKPFPATGDYSSFPQFATPAVTTDNWDDENGQDKSKESKTCYVVDQRTDYIVWQKDAFRNCLLSNSEVTGNRR